MDSGVRFQRSQLQAMCAGTADGPIVPAATTLLELTGVFARHETRHVLVQSTDGEIIGVLSIQQLQDAFRKCSGNESEMWHSRTVESLLTMTLSKPTTITTSPATATNDCFSVTEGNDLVAVLTPEDVLFSWNRLEPALNRATLDPLTLLPNRAHFERRFEEEWQRTARQRLSIGLMIIDVDRFKETNDRFGHLAGDLVLASIAQCCQRHLRPYDVVARYAGDEFLALTSGSSPDVVDLPIQRILQATREMRLQFEGCLVPASVSIGAAVATTNLEGLSPRDLLAAADRCLYQSKRAGRDRAFRIELTSMAAEPTPIETHQGELVFTI